MPLLCTVRDCHEPLARNERGLLCPRGHSFDIARSGYVNLLQPNDKRSKQPGDTAAAVAARRRLHDRGVTEPLLNAISALAAIDRDDVVLDVGCGDGYYLGSIALKTGCEAHGIDISVPAVDAAARRFPECEWVVGNADRFLPYAGKTFSCVLSITARMNVPELRRAARDDGRLLVAVPAPDDLVELRGAGRDRVARTLAEFGTAFTLVEQRRASTVADLDRDAVHDVLLSIYRPRSIEKVIEKRVTFSLDLLLFAPR
ncbi:MAG TPA: methyltransferase domain-containing protein [Thermoanaerobaculia bacterium]|jgi:23S rRNA (guanine745-N1)-methyltransferase|nr:methyltransferase domain-containing protein [Thermoanaerobaculia bacterium]